jgi:hypothetical protein
LYTAGLLFAGAGAAAAANGLGGRAGTQAGVLWLGCLAAGLSLALEVTYRHGVLAFVGSALGALAWLLAGLCPAKYLPGWPALADLVCGDGWQMARGLALLGGGAALALAWGLGNLTLGLMLALPRRPSQARAFSDGAYRALGLGVLLLAAGLLVGRLPTWGPLEAGAVAALAAFALLLQARFAGWVQDLGLALGCTLGFAGLVLAACAAVLLGPGGRHAPGVCALAWMCCAFAANAALAVHAVHRYWFSCPTRPG